MLTDKQIAAAAAFHRDHPEEAAHLVNAITSLGEASASATRSALKIAAQFETVLDRVSQFERRLLALEGVAGLGDLP